MRFIACASLLAALSLSAGTASAARFEVQVSGTSGGQSVLGGWEWDSAAPGATADPTAVGLLDPGIGAFSITVTSGAVSDTIDAVSIAGGISGSFDLTPTAGSPDIVNGSTCVEAAGGNGACPGGNTATIVFFNGNGSVGFILAGGGFNVPVTWTVTEQAATVPLPAGLPLLLGGLGALAALRRRSVQVADPA